MPQTTTLKTFTAFVSFLAISAFAHSSETLVSGGVRQTLDVSNTDCNSTCGAFEAVKQQCNFPHCECSYQYLQTQGGCLLCRTLGPQDAADVQLFLDEEINKCHEDGIHIQFKLDLPPDAQTIVDKFNRKSDDLRRYQTAFLALQIAGGHVGLGVILALTLSSRKVRRDATYLNFCVTWVFSSVVYSILLYRGTQGNTFEHPLGRVHPLTCLVQASLINGVQVMTACSTMSLIIHLWLALHTAICGDSQETKFVTYALLLLPYVLFLTFSIPSIFIGRMPTIIGNIFPHSAMPASFYCLIADKSFMHTTYGVTLTILLITFIFDLHVIVILYRHWRAFRHTRATAAVPLSIILRMIGFSIFRVAVAVAYGAVLRITTIAKETLWDSQGDALSISVGASAWVDMLQAMIPSVGFLVLGVNSEILSILMFWRKPTKSTAPSIGTTSTTSLIVDNSKKTDAPVDNANLETDTRHSTSNA